MTQTVDINLSVDHELGSGRCWCGPRSVCYSCTADPAGQDASLCARPQEHVWVIVHRDES